MQNNTCLSRQDRVIHTYSYAEYMELMGRFSSCETTSGFDQSEEKINVTKLNYARMRRLNKTIPVSPEIVDFLKNLQHPQCWTVITEAWCGDSAQNIPGIAALAAVSEGKIKLQFVFRDDNPHFMNRYLTNGGKAIPKLIARNLDGEDVFTWGPRPQTAAQMIPAWKSNPGTRTKDDVMSEMHIWYTVNNQQELFTELLLRIRQVEQEM